MRKRGPNHGAGRWTGFLPCLLALCLFCAGARGLELRGGKYRRPEIWLCPNGEHVLDLIDRTKPWRNVASRLAGVKLYIGTIKNTPDQKLAALAYLLRRYRLQVSIECAGTQTPDWGDEAGERTARQHGMIFRKWLRLGGRIDYLDMDGPIRRLLGHLGKGRKPRQPFTSYDRCARELVDFMRETSRQFGGVRFFLLTNFPNWGYDGDVSYHARGPKKQDYGDYREVLATVLARVRAARAPLVGITVDNPYEYLVGEHKSVNLKDPRKVDWLGRVRALEDLVHAQRLQFNLIVNSERGGSTSDEEFYRRTLLMLKTYYEAGGRPERIIIQSWYKYPVTVVPETAPHSMTALVKAAMDYLKHPGR